MIVIFLLAALGGCADVPTEGEVADAVAGYFERAHYKVIDLKIGKIEGTPLSEKTYMGTPGYVVSIASITIEPLADKNTDVRKGERLTFSDARIRVRQDVTDKNKWHVSIISGISVP